MKRFGTNSKKSKDIDLSEEIPSIDIEFENLSYNVGYLKSAQKQILKSISGKFLSGELTAILGSSGAGKTCLLNALSGYITNTVRGDLKINGTPCDMDTINRFSIFIMQEDFMQPYLTVLEEITFAAHLKLGKSVSASVKRSTANKILRLFNLSDCSTTRVENLSGGQKKRLSIALELVSNPPIIFLDEPTTGLDSVGVKQCIDVLKSLSKERRTVICTIHQPPASILQQFDQVYFIANGMCVYNGPPRKMPSFLDSIRLECPLTYNHADFVVELVESNPNALAIMVEATKNGKAFVMESAVSSKKDQLMPKIRNSPTSFWMQIYYLVIRMMIQQKRNVLGIWIQFLNHTLVALLLGTSFLGIGHRADLMVQNFMLFACVEIFLVYCYVMNYSLTIPPEIKILKREYFNGWYGILAYYSAMMLRGIPLLVLFVLEFLTITYALTDQPLEAERFLKFCLTGLALGFTSEGIGLLIGTLSNSRTGSVIAPILVTPFLVLMTYGFDFIAQVAPLVKYLMVTSFARYGLISLSLAMFKNRKPFYCPEEIPFCLHRSSNHFLKDLGLDNASYEKEMLGLVFFLVLFRILAYITLRLRLNYNKLSTHFASFVQSI